MPALLRLHRRIPGEAVEVYDWDFGGNERGEEGVGEDVHPAGAHDEIGLVGENERC